MILPDVELIEAHDILSFEVPDLLRPIPLTANTGPRFFNLNDMWRRGRYSLSLFADNNARSFTWLGQALEQGMPELPLTDRPVLESGAFWRWLGDQNAKEEHGIQARSKLRLVDFQRIRDLGVQSDLLFRLPRWAPPGESGTNPGKLYWTDPGLLHRSLGWDAARFDGFVAGLTASEIHRLRSTWKQDSWEGFVVTSLVRCAGVRATPSLWRGPDGEIDLILDWHSSRETWAIEVTMGRKKNLKSLGLGGMQTGAVRALVVYEIIVGRPRLKGLSRHDGVVECLTLLEALREVSYEP